MSCNLRQAFSFGHVSSKAATSLSLSLFLSHTSPHQYNCFHFPTSFSWKPINHFILESPQMKLESLVVSASINIGVALFLLSLFSILKKQPHYAPIYYARRLSLNHHIRFHNWFSLRRLLPSWKWISRVRHVTEDYILETGGLDLLVFVRMFKFGLHFFIVCSAVGLIILLPVNRTGNDNPPGDSRSLDTFTISNISEGSDKLWVHFSCLCFISGYGLYLLYKEYDHILSRRIHQLRRLRHRPDQFTVLVREIPFCDEHKTHGCCVNHFFSKYHPYTYQSYQILYDGKDLEHLLKKVKTILSQIGYLKQRATIDNQNNRSSLTTALREDAKLEELEALLQEMRDQIKSERSKKMLEEKELPVAFVTFRSRWGAALAAQSQQHPHPLQWITETPPEPRDVLWRSLAIPSRHLPFHKIAVYVSVFLLTIFFAIPVTAVQGIAKYERLKKWFPAATAMELIPGLRSVITGYVPSVILNGFILIIPYAIIGMEKMAGYISRSRKDIKACNMVFFFLVGNVFFLSLLSGSLLDQIGESFSHPSNIPNRLARAVSAQADFFVTYILTNGLAGFSLEALQPGLLIWDFLKSNTWSRGKKRSPYIYSFPYYRIVPFVSLVMMIGMIYAIVSPLLLPFIVGYLLLGYVVFINQIQDVYITTYETCGQYWPCIHHYILFAIVLMQITMIGLFGLKSKPAASFSTIPLLILTILFNEYCKIRFLPTFKNYSVKEAMKNDELDEKQGLMVSNLENACHAYSPPCLLPIDFSESISEDPNSAETSSTQSSSMRRLMFSV
ncbi:hypothetical protein LIER_17479 [Lithospermum erythrorhizon]|uniref:CSC1-like protein At3g54510 n=1 Tax=Lithospermum erythrorhizon TaxID=34254 RepID=A0AAV3QDQ6_LITER